MQKNNFSKHFFYMYPFIAGEKNFAIKIFTYFFYLHFLFPGKNKLTKAMNNSPHPQAFSHHLKVQESDIDELGHVNSAVYLRYVQEVAAAHLGACSV